MITVCAACQRVLEVDAEDRLRISHGVCAPCRTAPGRRGTPTLVVRRQHAALVPALEKLLTEAGILVVLDRRRSARRGSGGPATDEDRRQPADRRKAEDLLMG